MQQLCKHWQYNNTASHNITFHDVREFWTYWTLRLLSCFMDLWISTMITRIVVWILPIEHFETQSSENFIKFTKWSQKTSMGILIIFVPWTFSNISSMREEIYEQSVKLDNWLSFYGIFKIFYSRYPSQGPPKPSQAKLEKQHRQGAEVQPYPVIT